MLLQKPVLSAVKLVDLIVLIGVLSTCRIVFVFLPLLIGFNLFASSYPPLSLLTEKAQASFFPEGLILAITAAIVMLIHWGTWGPITHLAMGFAVPWIIIAVADLLRVHGSLSDWDGASFLAFPLPFLVLATITNNGNGRNEGVDKTPDVRNGVLCVSPDRIVKVWIDSARENGLVERPFEVLLGGQRCRGL